MNTRRHASEGEQFSLQTQFTLVIQQLERMERVVEGVRRPNTIQRNTVGDRNHQSPIDNYAALKSKLMCLSSTLEHLDSPESSNACVAALRQWYEARAGRFTPVLLKAIDDTLAACTGKFKFTLSPLSLTPEEVAECESRLAAAFRDFGEMERRFLEDPQGYLAGDRPYCVIRPVAERVNVEEFQRRVIQELKSALRDYTRR